MEYRKLLNLSLIPTIILLLLSLVSVILTTHYWILADWFVLRWVKQYSGFDQKDRFQVDDVLIDYSEATESATITSGCLLLAAAITCIVAYFKLKPSDMDLDYHTPLRRFWVIASIGMTAFGMCAALAAIVIPYTDKGPDIYGCSKTTGKTASGGVPFTNLHCSREITMCTVIPKMQVLLFNTRINEWAYNLACNEAMAVKWLQIVLLVNGAFVVAMFSSQARVRRTRRSPAAKGL